jgi:hypothetical protein
VGKNGITHRLQELAFFSWFFGNPSLGLHSGYSNNSTSLSETALSACPLVTSVRLPESISKRPRTRLRWCAQELF